jgi:hypothetical protein
MNKALETYLKAQLESKKLWLNYLSEQHRIDIAVFNAKREIIQSEIDAMEKQLGGYDNGDGPAKRTC